MEKKNYLLVKTNRGIEKIQLYKSLDEIVGVKEEDLTVTNSEEISLFNLKKNIFPFTYKIDENALAKKITSFTYIPSAKMKVYFDSKTPPLKFTDDKKIAPFIQAVLYYSRKRLINEKINLFPGELVVNLNLAGRKFSFTNKQNIYSFIFEKKALINYNDFFSLDINEDEYNSIEDFYIKLYGKNWKEKLNKEIKNNVDNFISVYYRKKEEKNNVNAEIKNNEVVVILEDGFSEFEETIVLPMDIKLNLKQEVLKFGLENRKVLTVEEKYANKEITESELKTILKETEVKKDQKIDGYIVQTIDSSIYKLYKNKISGNPILIDNYYVLKTAGTKEKIFRNEYDELFFIERDIEKYQISSEFFKDNGGTILVCSGAGAIGNGKYGGIGGNGMMLRYEIPSKPTFTNILLSAKFEAGGSNGSTGEAFDAYTKGEKGGEGGKNVTAILNEGKKETKLVAYGGGGGGGSGLLREYNKSETSGGIGGRDGSNRKINNEADGKIGGKGTDANVYKNIEIYEKNIEDAKIIVGAYLE